MYKYIYIYIEREREIHTHTYISHIQAANTEDISKKKLLKPPC